MRGIYIIGVNYKTILRSLPHFNCFGRVFCANQDSKSAEASVSRGDGEKSHRKLTSVFVFLVNTEIPT
jgi:hypothetical protein